MKYNAKGRSLLFSSHYSIIPAEIRSDEFVFTTTGLIYLKCTEVGADANASISA